MVFRICNSPIRSGCKISLTDFSQITAITSEAFPEAHDKKSSMPWYWESSHYKFDLGLLVIKYLWNDPSAIKNFGKNPTVENIKSENIKDRAALRKYMSSNPTLPAEFLNYNTRN